MENGSKIVKANFNYFIYLLTNFVEEKKKNRETLTFYTRDDSEHSQLYVERKIAEEKEAFRIRCLEYEKKMNEALEDLREKMNALSTEIDINDNAFAVAANLLSAGCDDPETVDAIVKNFRGKFQALKALLAIAKKNGTITKPIEKLIVDVNYVCDELRDSFRDTFTNEWAANFSVNKIKNAAELFGVDMSEIDINDEVGMDAAARKVMGLE